MGNRRIVKGNCVYEKKTTSLSNFDGIMLYDDAYYTISNIPSTSIEVYTKYGWIPIRACNDKDKKMFKTMNIIKDEFDNNIILL